LDAVPCESWMIDYLKTFAQSSSPSEQPTETISKPSKTVDTASKSKSKADYADILNTGAVEGMRNHTATKLIGHLLGKGNEESVAWELVKLWNSRKNDPPLDETELRKCFNSVKKLESKNEHKKIDVARFLDNSKKVITEHEESYFKIPFAGPSLSQLETRMNDGLIGGRFYLLGGIPSSSKTMLVNNLADNICANDQPVLVFSYDDGKTELRYRTFSRFSSHTIEDFNQKKLNKDDMRQICLDATIDKIMKFKYVVEVNISIEKWGDLIDQIEKRHRKPPVIMIDYLRKLRTENSTSDERLRVDKILSNLTGSAKKHNIPVLAISELARDSYKSGQRLSMASFKESGTIEYEASWLGILAAVEEKNGGYHLKNDWEKIIEHDGNVDLIVFKAKRGTGITGKIPLKVDKDKMTVTEREEYNIIDTTETIARQSMFGTRRK
jgi:replicative DNA helicase